jgi:hypothetical protein
VQGIAVGGDDAALPRGDRLVGREREAACKPERADHTAGVTRSQALGGVADQCQVLGAADRLQPSVIGATAVDVDGHQRPRARSDRGFHAIGVDAEADRLHVYEFDVGAGHPHRIGGGREGQIGDQHLVAWADPGRHQRQRNRRGSAGHGDGVACAHQRRDPALEFAGKGAVVDVLAVQHVAQALQLPAGQMRPEPRNRLWNFGIGHRARQEAIAKSRRGPRG